MVNKQVGHVELDRSGLTAVLDQYLAAVLRHKPSEAPLADNYRSTENVADVKLGEGIWKTAVALGKLQLHYTDPVTQQVGYYGLIEETTGTAITTLRLQVVDRRSPKQNGSSRGRTKITSPTSTASLQSHRRRLPSAMSCAHRARTCLLLPRAIMMASPRTIGASFGRALTAIASRTALDSLPMRRNIRAFSACATTFQTRG